MKRGGLGIPYPRLLVEREYNTYKAASEVLVGSLLGGNNFNYVAHKGCIHRASAERWKEWDFLETAALTRRKDLAYRAVSHCLQRAT